LEPWEEVDNLRDYMAKKGVYSLGLCMIGRREMVYFGLICVLIILLEIKC
jgi:hypothetical protein